MDKYKAKFFGKEERTGVNDTVFQTLDVVRLVFLEHLACGISAIK